MLPSTSKTDSPIEQINTEEELKKIQKDNPDKPVILLFWASWDQASEVLKSMMTEMPKAYKSVRLGYVDCDESDLVDTLDVETV